MMNELYESGLTKAEIATKLGLCASTVSAHTPREKKFLNEDVKKQITDLYFKGLTHAEIGKRIGMHSDSVSKVARTLPKRKKPHNIAFKEEKERPVKVKKLRTVKPKQKPDSFGKEVNIKKIETKVNPPLYKRLKIRDRTWIDTFSEEEYEAKKVKYNL